MTTKIEEKKWKGMHNGTVRNKPFEPARRARPKQAQRRAKHQHAELNRGK